MYKVVYETEYYKKIRLYETETMKIEFVEDKQDRDYDKIKIVKFGNQCMDPELIAIYRYEDEQLIKGMLNTYGYKE